MAKVRLNMEVSEDLVKLIDNLADKEYVTRTEIVRRALAVMKAYDTQIQRGKSHIVFTSEPKDSDVEMVGVLTAPLDEPPRLEARPPATDPQYAAVASSAVI